jgi:hypothetical protein
MMTDTTAQEVKTGQDAFDELAKIAEQQERAAPENEREIIEEIDEAFPFEPLPVNLPSGWAFSDWKQRHIMALVETDCFTTEYHNRWRRNYEVAKAAIESGCFEKPTAVEPGILDDMNIWDVEALWVAINAEFINRRNTPKNS